MNSNQKIIIIIGLIVLVLMVLFPPSRGFEVDNVRLSIHIVVVVLVTGTLVFLAKGKK